MQSLKIRGGLLIGYGAIDVVGKFVRACRRRDHHRAVIAALGNVLLGGRDRHGSMRIGKVAMLAVGAANGLGGSLFIRKIATEVLLNSGQRIRVDGIGARFSFLQSVTEKRTERTRESTLHDCVLQF